MTLTHDDLIALKATFAANEHEFLQGNAYIQEQPITDRIEQIDPAWCFEIRSINVRDNAGEGSKDVFTVTVHAALTIKGVTRENVGMATIQKSNPVKEMAWNDAQKRKVETGNTYTSEANEGEKSATTDALKRCARLFGIGRYLLTLPDDVKDMGSMAKWLNTQKPAAVPPASGTQPTGSGLSEAQWKHALFDGSKFLYTVSGQYNEHQHRNSLKKRMEDTGELGLNIGLTLLEALNRLIRYRALHDLFLDTGDYPNIFAMPFEEYIDKHGHLATWQRMNDYFAAQLEPAQPKKAS